MSFQIRTGETREPNRDVIAWSRAHELSRVLDMPEGLRFLYDVHGFVGGRLAQEVSAEFPRAFEAHIISRNRIGPSRRIVMALRNPGELQEGADEAVIGGHSAESAIEVSSIAQLVGNLVAMDDVASEKAGGMGQEGLYPRMMLAYRDSGDEARILQLYAQQADQNQDFRRNISTVYHDLPVAELLEKDCTDIEPSVMEGCETKNDCPRTYRDTSVSFVMGGGQALSFDVSTESRIGRLRQPAMIGRGGTRHPAAVVSTHHFDSDVWETVPVFGVAPGWAGTRKRKFE